MQEELSPSTFRGEGGERYERVRVTIEVDYLVPANTEEQRERLIGEWFFNPSYPIYGSHAYRDSQKLGYSDRIVRVERLLSGGDASLEKRPLEPGAYADMDGSLRSTP